MSSSAPSAPGPGGSSSDATPPASGNGGEKRSNAGIGTDSSRVSRKLSLSNPYDAFFAADAKFVGSSSLISSPNTIVPTDKAFVKLPPMPSVHTDGRGEVWNLRVGSFHPDAETVSRRINLSHTRTGVMRHGDFHPNTQCGFIFSGKVEVWTPGSNGSTEKTTYGPKDYIEIPPYVPHVYNFLEETIMAEFWETSSGESAHFKHWFYAPYRRIVDVSFVRTTAGEKGKLRVFRELASVDSDDMYIPSKTNWFSLIGAATTVGAIGFVIGVSFATSRSAKMLL